MNKRATLWSKKPSDLSTNSSKFCVIKSKEIAERAHVYVDKDEMKKQESIVS